MDSGKPGIVSNRQVRIVIVSTCARPPGSGLDLTNAETRKNIRTHCHGDRRPQYHLMSRVLMIVTNSCVTDTRVIKEAEALAAAGHLVQVLCRLEKGLPEAETINGVEFRRMPMESDFGFKRRRQAHSGDNEPGRAAPRVAGPGSGRSPGRNADGFRQGALERVVGVSLRLLFAPIQVIGYCVLTCRAIGRIAQYRPDVIHAHDLLPLLLALAGNLRVHAKVIYDAHELETHRNGQGRVASRLIGLIEGICMKGVDAVITVSPGIAAYLADCYNLEEPTVVLNAPDSGTQPAHVDGQGDVRSATGLPADTPLVIYVGKITFNRGLEQVINALPHLQRYHFVMLGPRHDETLRTIVSEAVRLGVADRVHVLDPVPPKDVVSFIRTADVGVVPTQDACLSYRYSMPNKLFEMAFAGLPICASNLPDQRKVVESLGNGIIMDERSPVDIARALRQAYERRDELRADPARLSAKAQQYTWGHQKQKLLQVYEKLARL